MNEDEVNASSSYGEDQCYICGRDLATANNGWSGPWSSFSGWIDGEQVRVCRDHVDDLDE